MTMPSSGLPARRAETSAQDAEVTVIDDRLSFSIDGQVAWITICRPEARNAFTFSMYEQLEHFLVMAIQGAKVLILTGADPSAFSAGTDIHEFRKMSTADQGLRYEKRMDALLDLLERAPIATVAAISGACTGAGAAIASCCDIRIGSRSARLGFPIADTLGNCLSLANYSRLAAIIGAGCLKEIIFSARLMGAAEALRSGWLHEIVSDGDLRQRAAVLAGQLASRAPLTLRVTKAALIQVRDSVTEESNADLVGMCYGSADFREGVDAFLGKRAARWCGR